MRRGARKVLPLGVLMAVLIPSAALAATQNVTIIDYAFVPEKLSVHLGDTVVWTNTGNADHTSSSDDPLRICYRQPRLMPPAATELQLEALG